MASRTAEPQLTPAFCRARRSRENASRRRDFTVPIGKLVRAAMVACDRPSKKASCTILNCSRGKASSAARTCSSRCAVGDAGVAARAGIGNGEQVRVRVAVLAAAAADVDAAIVGDAEHPGGGRRFAPVEQMRLAPDRLHHVLGDVGGGEWREPKAEHLGVHARTEMIEQSGERLVVAMVAHRGEQIVQLVASGRSVFAARLELVSVKPRRHARPPSSHWSAQLAWRSEIDFRPRRGAPPTV